MNRSLAHRADCVHCLRCDTRTRMSDWRYFSVGSPTGNGTMNVDFSAATKGVSRWNHTGTGSAAVRQLRIHGGVRPG
jgi:hypothetical protein